MSSYEIGLCGEACVAAKLAGQTLANEWANDPKAHELTDPYYSSLTDSNKNDIAKCIFAQRLGLCMPKVDHLREGE